MVGQTRDIANFELSRKILRFGGSWWTESYSLKHPDLTQRSTAAVPANGHPPNLSGTMSVANRNNRNNNSSNNCKASSSKSSNNTNDNNRAITMKVAYSAPSGTTAKN